MIKDGVSIAAAEKAEDAAAFIRFPLLLLFLTAL